MVLPRWPGVSRMAIKYVVGARIDERGKASGGKAGDQTDDGTGRGELCVHQLTASGSWVYILRPPRNADAIVKAAYATAANDHVGYDQSQRTTFYDAAKKVGWDISAIKTDVETECAAAVSVWANCAGYNVSMDMYTGDEVAALKAVGFTCIAYASGSLKPGDVLWRKGHTVVYVGTNKTYTKDVSQANAPVVAKLVDLSHWNGNVDLAKIKAAGWHVVLKCGDNNISGIVDPTFQSRAKKCEQLGIPYGVYWYARARNATQAKTEAQRCLNIIKGRKLSYPVYYDIEEASLGNFAGDTCKAFCTAIEKAGYWAGIYSGDSYWQQHLIKRVGDKYTKWVARYGVNNGQPSYKPVTKKYDIWQYSSKGTVPGVSGKCDVNNVYKDLPKAITGKTPSKPSGSTSPAKKEEIKYRARLYGSKKWLPEVTGSKSYAGTYGNSIGYLAIKGVKRYRVRTSKGWLPWVSRYDTSDLNNGCAGDGSPIVAVQVDDTSCRYAVHVVGGGWLPDMVGQKDTGGSKDTFAGNGKKVDGFRAKRV